MADAQRSMGIAKEEGMSLKQKLYHYVISSSQVFDGEPIPANVNKFKLSREIESRLELSKDATYVTCPFFHSRWCNYRCHQLSVKYM
ncbi:hypothetical protein DPMN_192213 [Dreissena polymorpha]|uniref:Uncharacterized protein n=1 Tax=Dreissena polymorpha TaxID=45954 RepID=A0A9D3Y0W5_DREPO|nr:hypothetical protein DPMN_192213 [Dreissena polymorpha]